MLISRQYRGFVAHSVVSRFVSQLLEEDEVDLKPVMEDEGVTYLYIKHNNLYLLAVTDVNASAAMILRYLYQVVEVSERSSALRKRGAPLLGQAPDCRAKKRRKEKKKKSEKKKKKKK